MLRQGQAIVPPSRLLARRPIGAHTRSVEADACHHVAGAPPPASAAHASTHRGIGHTARPSPAADHGAAKGILTAPTAVATTPQRSRRTNRLRSVTDSARAPAHGQRRTRHRPGTANELLGFVE